MDLQSLFGYAFNSPFINSTYLDIQTPEGLISMQNTPFDLMGIDNLGNTKIMKAGKKSPYRFKGNVVREIPMQQGGLTSSKAKEMLRDGTANGKKLTKKQKAYFGWVAGGKKQMGGNPYKGLTPKQMFDFLFDDEDTPKEAPKAPTVQEVDIQVGINDQNILRRIEDENNNELAMSMIMDSPTGNPYNVPQQQDIPYMGPILSSGKFGSKNVGDYGRKIYGQLARDLGYTPVINSIFRSKEQQDALIAAGAPAVKNSWHLSGNAIDLKPEDWHKLSNEQQQYYTNNYDVVVHNGHYHIEPR